MEKLNQHIDDIITGKADEKRDGSDSLHELVGNRYKQRWMVKTQEEIDAMSQEDWEWYERGECVCDGAMTYHHCQCGSM